jgi:hypothetical protein
MRLLHAELTKLRRPLLWCIVVALVVFAVMMGWVGVRNASGQYLASMQTGSVADGQQVPSPQEGQQAEGTSVVEGALQHPIGIGALAAGMSASLPGRWRSFCWPRATWPRSGVVAPSRRC